MPRSSLTAAERQLGIALGQALAARRAATKRSAEHVAHAAGISVETLRSIERGLVANPGIFTLDEVASQVGADLTDLARNARCGS